MGKYTNIILFLIGTIILISSAPKIYSIDKSLKKMEYKGKEGQSNITVNFKLIGAKKAGACILWIKHVLDVGSYEGRENVNLLKENSYNIAYLDPYFTTNYYLSGCVISLINTLKRPDIGLEILKKGLEYNPDNYTMKFYIAGIIAYNKNDIEKLINMFEEIIKVHRDDMIINILGFVYETRYKKSKDIRYLNGAMQYWKMLEESKEDEYRKKAGKKIKEYESILN